MNLSNKLTVTRSVSVVFALLALSSCGKPPETQSGILRRGLSGEPATLDPTSAGDTFSNQVLIDLFEGLTAESPSGDPIPATAESWEVDSSGTRYTFHIRANAKWSNGEPVVATQFVQAWRHVLDPRAASSGADDLTLIVNARRILARDAGIEELGAHAVDPKTLVVELDHPAPFFPGLLAHPSTFPIFSVELSSNRVEQPPKRPDSSYI